MARGLFEASPISDADAIRPHHDSLEAEDATFSTATGAVNFDSRPAWPEGHRDNLRHRAQAALRFGFEVLIRPK